MKPLIVHRFRFQLDRAGRLRRSCGRIPLCGVRGCRQWGSPCWLPDDDWDEPSSYYCYLHMRDQGFCPGCGNFWAGVESFDFSRTGYCENCEGDNFEFDDMDDWDDAFNDWDDLPHMQVMRLP